MNQAVTVIAADAEQNLLERAAEKERQAETAEQARIRRYIRWGIAAAAVIVACLCIVASVPWGRFQIIGTVVARRVAMQVSEPLDLDLDADVNPADVLIHGATSVTPPAPGDVSAHYQLAGSKIRLAGLHILPGGMLVFARSPDGLAISVDHAGASAEFEVTPAPGKTDDPGASASISEVTVTKEGAGGPPLLLQTGGATKLDIDDFDITGLQFGQYRGASGSGRPFSSSILSGSVTLVQTEDTQDVKPGGAVAIGGFRGSIVRMTSEPEGIHVWFTGSATQLHVGSPGLRLDRTPSILDVIIHMPFVKLGAAFLSSVVALAGTALAGTTIQWPFGKKTS